MQQNQPPQYVTHRAQQELIKEFFMAKKEKSPEIRGPVLNNRSYNFQNNNCRISSHREQYLQAHQVQKQESLLSADCSQINQPNSSVIQKQSFLNSNLQLNEPMSAQIPQTSGSVFNSGSILKNSGCYNASSARGQYMSRHEPMHTADRNDSIDRNSFSQGTGFMKCGNLKNSITAESASSVRVHPQQNEASCFASQHYSQRPAQLKIMDQSSSMSNQNQVETHTSQNTVNDMLGFQNTNRPIQNSNKYENLQLNMVNSFSTGKDFADMVSLETENCLKKKQNSTSPNTKTQQQNYKQMSLALTTGLTNNKFNDKHQIKIKTAITDGYTHQSIQQPKEIPLNLKKASCNSQNACEKFDQRGQVAPKHQMTQQPGNQKVQQYMQTQSTRVVPQMHMKQLCNALNSTNISSKQSMINQSSNQFNQKKEKQSFDHMNMKSSQNFTTNSYDLESIAQKVNSSYKQPKSYDRTKNQTKVNQGSYSPFQNRLYKQYQQQVPNSQVSNRQNTQNAFVNLQSQRQKLEVQEQKYQQMISYNNLGYQSTNPSRDNSAKTKQSQQQIQQTNQMLRKSNLQNPKVLSQKRLESNSTSSVRNSQVNSHTLLSSTGVLAKSNGDKAADSHNQTVLQDSTNQESTQADQSRQNTQMYMRKLDAYDKLERKQPVNGLNYTDNVSDRGKYTTHNFQKNNKENSHGVQSYKQFKSSHFQNATDQNEYKSKESAQNLGAGKNHQTILETENSRLSQLQTSKSACITSRCHGPTVVSGPQIQISKNTDGQINNDLKQINASQRQSLLRQSAYSINNKVQNNSSRKSIGLQQTLNSLGNSRKQLETAKTGSYKTNQTVTIEGKNDCHSKLLSYKTHKTPTSNTKNIQLFNKNSVISQNTCSFASQRAKKSAIPSYQMEQNYPKMSPKSSEYQSKPFGDNRQKRNTQLNGGDSSSNSQLKCRYTPTKTDVQRKAKVSPFKPVKTQSNSNKTTEVAQSNQNVETSHLQTSPEHCSQITAELRYLYERQKKMVAQLSQNKIGRSVQPYQPVPGLSLNNINETVFTNQPNNTVKSSQTPKQQQNILTPSSCKQAQNVNCNEPKTMRGNIPASYQSLICNPQLQIENNYNKSNSQAVNQYNNALMSNKQFSSNSNCIQNKNQGVVNENRQSVNQNLNSLRYQNTGIAVGTHRDFIQENKKLSSNALDKFNQNQQQNIQQRATFSQGKSGSNKQNSKEKYRSDLRISHQNYDKATPKKLNDKKEQLVQKQKFKNDLSKTQYLSKKQYGANQTKKQPNQLNHSNIIGSIIKSPSHRALMATQIVDMQQYSQINESLLNNQGLKQLQENFDNSCKSNLQQYIKNKDKLNKSLNMTINIAGTNRQDCSSSLNTQRIITKNTQKNSNSTTNKMQTSSNKCQQRYMQTQPEEQDENNQVQKFKTKKEQQMAEYLRTFQNSQVQPQNQETLTFAINTNNMNDQINNQVNNPTFQKQHDSVNQLNNTTVQTQNTQCGQVQITECSREQILQQNDMKQATGQFDQVYIQNQEILKSQIALENSQIQNIDNNQFTNLLNNQIQNVMKQQDQCQDYNIQQDLQYQNVQKAQNSNNTILTNLEDNHIKINQSNIVSFQQFQEKSLKSTEQRSPVKKYSQKQEKENLNYHFNQAKQKQLNNNLQKIDKKEMVQQDLINLNKINTSGNKIQTDCALIIKDNQVENKTNTEQNIQQYLPQGAQKQERQIFAPQNLNEKYPETKVQETLNQTQTRTNQLEMINQQRQVNQVQNVNDTMCFSQKSSLDEYVIGKQIGQGAYAVVRIGLHKPSNKKVALKIYKKFKLEEPNRRKSVKREIKLMDKMKHNSIVQLFEIIDTSKYVILVMEYVGGSSLHGYLKSKSKRRLEEWDAKRIFKQIIEGLKYCHSRCITHRDIKLENLLLDENNRIKIIDFGFSTCIPNDKKIKIFCGTPSYMAPEIVMKTEYCGPPADIWAMGVLLFTILSGQFPYRGATDEELYDKICRADYHLPKEVKESLSPASKDLLAKLFQLNPDDRPTARQILEHQWLYNVDKKDNQPAPINKDNAALEKSNEYLQLQKRAKSQRLDFIGAPKNKNCDTSNPIERQVDVNPFNVVQINNESHVKKNYPEEKNQLLKTNQADGRMSSHIQNKSQIELNQKIIKLIAEYMPFDTQQVEIQVKNNQLINNKKDNNFKINSNGNFITNLYHKLLEEDNYDKQIALIKQIKQKQMMKSQTSISEQFNNFMGSDGKSQQKSDNGYYSANLFNQTQQLLMKSAISQTSLGMSTTGPNMTSQGFGQANGQQNMAVQPSIIPSIKSINSGSVSGNNFNENTICISKFNNTMNPSLNINKSGVYQPNILSSINFNHTQPLKGILDNLNDTTTSKSGMHHHQLISSPQTHREQNLPLNFTQTNIFVTNNNQVFGDTENFKTQTEQKRNDFYKDESSQQIKEQNQQIANDCFFKKQFENLKIKDNNKTDPQSKAYNLLVNNFFTECENKSVNNKIDEQESPNFRQRGDSELKY